MSLNENTSEKIGSTYLCIILYVISKWPNSNNNNKKSYVFIRMVGWGPKADECVFKSQKIGREKVESWRISTRVVCKIFFSLQNSTTAKLCTRTRDQSFIFYPTGFVLGGTNTSHVVQYWWNFVLTYYYYEHTVRAKNGKLM